MFDAFKRSGKPGGNDWPRLVVLSIILSLRAYNADYDDDDDSVLYILIKVFVSISWFMDTCILYCTYNLHVYRYIIVIPILKH